MENKGKSEVSKKEEEILAFWKEKKIFEKTLKKPAPKGDWVFFDGPPFATGSPHYGHILAGTIKDAIPRYKTMTGYRVNRKWGWDCHGVPIENLVQKELNIKTKKDIEIMGIKNFNEAARASVFRYKDEWKNIIPRTGRFVDMENDYTTMDPSFMESVWWSFGKLWEKGLVYEGFQSMHISPLLETPLSNFEVGQNYRDITDISVYAKFELVLESGTFLIAWTTTPWTLPGNVALAVGNNINYVLLENQEKGEKYIVAEARVSFVDKENKFKKIKEIKGSDLVGKSYKPLFDYYSKDKNLPNHERGWKIYAGDFVTTEDGTGIVHIAPAFGEDDLKLSQKENLPFVQHVNIDGTIKTEIDFLAGKQAKPKEDPTATDVEIVKNLAHRGLLFAKEKFTHSYPFCWRTDAPLLNYAMSSWFVRVTDLKEKLISENKRVNWVPSEVGDKRFGNWLLNVKDWSISRSRYWGTPIPIWKSEDGKEVEVISGMSELREKNPESFSDIFLMRHGESDKNIAGVYNRTDKYTLTENGKNQAIEAGKKLKKENISLVFCSPIRRAKETAEIVAKETGAELIIAEELTEVNNGEWEDKRKEEIQGREEYSKLPEQEHYVAKRGGTGESWKEIEERSYAFISKTIKENPGKKIIFVTHAGIIGYALRALKRLSLATTQSLFDSLDRINYATPMPIVVDRNTLKAFDFHRPYIDAFTWKSKTGQIMKRIPEVFDTWYDSGSMPYGQHHYPFENKKDFLGKKFPADFIAEGQDQTRGWFYTLLVVSTALFGKVPYKNVVVNGIVLAEDGQKMSKRLNNYPPVEKTLDVFGADAMRFYLLSSPVVRAQDFSFSEKGLDEVVKKIILRLKNVLSFYELYKDSKHNPFSKPKTTHILDKWIIARLNEVIKEVTNSMEAYELDKATRPFEQFVDDLSTWYLRRSRDRFKGENEKDRNEALNTLGFVLLTLSKLLAPFMPFTAEDMYGRIGGKQESVHLEDWPKVKKTLSEWLSFETEDVISPMIETRRIVSLALEARSRANIKVRQPLASLSISSVTLKGKDGYLGLVRDEINVKEIIFDTKLSEQVVLDTKITQELRKEGICRDLVRFVQDLRKSAGLSPHDKISLVLKSNEEGRSVLETYHDEFCRSVNVRLIKEGEGTENISIDSATFSISLEK